MKKIFSILISALVAVAAQAAPTMNFARTVMTSDGLPKANLSVKVRVTIHSGSADGQVVFGEVHSVVTSPAGVAYINVGSLDGATTLDQLDWGNTVYYMETAVDCGFGFEDSVCQQILSVPRAIHADSASAVVLESPSGKKFKVVIDDNGQISATELN